MAIEDFTFMQPEHAVGLLKKLDFSMKGAGEKFIIIKLAVGQISC